MAFAFVFGICFNDLPLPLPFAFVFALAECVVDICLVSNGTLASLERLFSKCVGGGQAGGLGCLLPLEMWWKGTSADAEELIQ